jgi:hypothetical protein
MTAVNLLEANWISIQEIFELVSRVLTRMFVGLWPKQKAEVPNNDVKKLAKAFDTTADPVLQLKGLSLKQVLRVLSHFHMPMVEISTGSRLALLMAAPAQS